MTATAAAKQLDISQSTLSRIESREIGVKPVVVRAALSLYGVPADEAEAIIEVSRGAQQRGWWQSFSDVMPNWFSFYVGLEEEAAHVETYQNELIPGLLQTEGYARATHRSMTADDDLDRKVALRMRRQRILTRDNPASLHAIINEAALLRHVGGPVVMIEQLDHLINLAKLPNVTIQVLPFTGGSHPAMNGPYVILTFPDAVDEPVVYLDNYTVGSILEDPEPRAWYHQTNRSLSELALDPDESIDHLQRVSGTFELGR